MSRVLNFSAGPAVLPEEVLAQAGDEMLDWRGSGMCVMEMSHRGKEYMEIHAQAERDLRELLAIPSRYKVLFLQGGASLQFGMLPINLCPPGGKADYVVTGEWSKKAVKEAAPLCDLHIAASSEDRKFTCAPAAGRVAGCARTLPTCITARTRPSAGWSSTGCPAPGMCRWWRTRPRTSCRARSMCRSSA